MSKIITLIITVTITILILAGAFYYFSRGKKDTVNNVAQGDSSQHNIEEQSRKDVREVVWGQLSSSTKEKINGTWQDGKISKVILKTNMMGKVSDKSYEGKEVYLIDFPSKESALSNIIVYADEITYAYIGDGLVD